MNMNMKEARFKVTLQHPGQISDQTLTMLRCFRVLESPSGASGRGAVRVLMQ